MSIIAEFTLPVDAFPLGQALRITDGMRVELERVVPVADIHIPYVWVDGGDFEAFERQVGADHHVDAVSQLDRVGDQALYRVDWAETESGLINGSREVDAAIVNAVGRETWRFRLHFLDHDRLAAFYNYCTRHDIPIYLERVYSLADAAGEGRAFDLTPARREALVTALQKGQHATGDDAHRPRHLEAGALPARPEGDRTRPPGGDALLDGLRLSDWSVRRT